MTRHELAKLRFKHLAPTLGSGLDETGSDRFDAWLRDDVVPVVEDLLGNPGFRRPVLGLAERLFSPAPSVWRVRVESLADALAAEARTLVAAAREFDLIQAIADQDRDLDEDWIKNKAPQNADTRSVIEKLSERPWFDMANSADFWTPSMDLYLRQPDALLTRQYRRGRSDWKLLGDHVVELMFARFDFWKKRSEKGRRQLQTRLPADASGVNAQGRILACAFDVDQKYHAVLRDWREGDDARLRNACAVLLQTFIAYRPVPQLDWLGCDARELEVNGRMIRAFFRHRGTLNLVEAKSDGQLHLLGTRQADLIDPEMIRQVAAALEDLAAMYHRGVHADDLIAEARDRFRLVVVVNPRMVFWDGTLPDLPWTTADKSWNLLLHLAVKAEGLLPLRGFELTCVTNSRVLIVRKSNLDKFLSHTVPGAELAARIDKARGGDCRLDLQPAEVKVLDVPGDEWTVDRSEFQSAP